MADPTVVDLGPGRVRVGAWFGCTLTVMMSECCRGPLLPVTVTVNVPTLVPETKSIAVPDPTMVDALRRAAIVESEDATARLTILENPDNAEMVTVEVPVAWTTSVIVTWLAPIAKSAKVKLTVMV